MFTSALGSLPLSGHVNGIWNKGGFKNETQNFKYDYKYITPDIDLMLNLVTLFGKKDWYPVNLYLIGGVGLNVAWDNDDAYAARAVMPMAWNCRQSKISS